MFPRQRRNFVRVEGITRFFSMRLGALAQVASSDVLLDLSLHAWPPVVSGDVFLGFPSSWMSSGNSIVVFADNVCAKLRVSGNIKSVFVGNLSMSIINPVFIVRVQSFECLSVVFIFMQVGKSFSNSFWEGSKKQFCSVQSLIKGAKVVFRKQSDIFIVILPLVKTWRSRQEIRFCVCRAWFMKEFKMILLEFCEPASLAAIYFLWLAEILEILVICPYFKGFCCAN